ncbi:MAG TPA: glycosyltransferase family 2 protein [Oscillospiraceae bacterium]|nr:glycosyltransferase family 2 protein [Oscillospiraceae bacterium]HPF56996.1 glycosyltransferase family 2 protein [Clostridiales bacterium]HPK34715.1 glycosyltransferase family 2 protein [Oscillospiraceae bacterium]HPR74521.1 glycosyltransferase family 2 protein [Oscillospiraceae bacterium]
MELSVVIPVYNAAKYLNQCLDSILNQDLMDFEIIAVDDGSTDNSYIILDEYAQKDSRVKVIRQSNQGAGPARNHGMALATGNYVTFFDADDFMPENCLKSAYEFAESHDADVAVFLMNHYCDDIGVFETPHNVHLIPHPPYGTVFSIHDDPDRFPLMFSGIICAKFFRREFLKETGIEFMPLANCNDVFFVFCNLILAQRVVCSDITTMHYRIRTGTSITDGREKNPLCTLYANEAIHDFAASLPWFPKIKRGIANLNAKSMNEFFSNYKTAAAFRALYIALHDEGLRHMELTDLPKKYIYSRFISSEMRHIRYFGPFMPKNAKRNILFWKEVTFLIPGLVWFFTRTFENGFSHTFKHLKHLK